jgi:hypothetical protein
MISCCEVRVRIARPVIGAALRRGLICKIGAGVQTINFSPS